MRHGPLLGILLLAPLAGCDAKPPAEGVRLAALPSDVELDYTVEGMTCDGCVQFITDRVSKIDGVVSCDVSLEQGTALVRARNEEVGAAVLESMSATPYTVKPQ